MPVPHASVADGENPSRSPLSERRYFDLGPFADRAEARPAFVFGILTLFYVLMLVPFASRLLWHDELFTLYISNAPTFQRFIENVRHLDLNPPLLYAVTRIFNAIFGKRPLATRLPAILAFYGASYLFFTYLQSKMGTLWGALGVLLFWSSYFFRYAAEARPYALLLFFFAETLVSYDRAICYRARRRGLAGIALGCAGMILSHVFAPFSIAPFLLAELVRSVARRKIDFAIWAALLVPLLALAVYVPLVGRFQVVLFPPEFQASVANLINFYAMVLKPSVLVYIAAAGIGTWIGARLSTGRRYPGKWRTTDAVVGAVLVVAPVLVTLALMRSHGAFWDRYCITSGWAILVLAAAALGALVAHNRAGALLGLGLLMAVMFVTKFVRPLRTAMHTPATAAQLEGIDPTLPLVSASGVTFLEMDHVESPALKSRLYFLTDRAAAIRYAHATLFEGMASLTAYFPIQAHIEKFEGFSARHRSFLMLSRPDFPENWLLPKLRADHATVEHLADLNIPYEDKSLYRITLPPAQ